MFRFLPVLLVTCLGLMACTSAPPQVPKRMSLVQPSSASAPLAQMTRRWQGRSDGMSGVQIVGDGIDALALRIALSDLAQTSIDAQYYLLHNDVSGGLFADALLRAADRGVRVRLLLDDMDTRGYDAATRALETHPNIEIRLYNPFLRSRSKALSALLEFGRINRRMHNKSMSFDGQITIVGGRNIGDEYFSAREDSNYDDLDLLAAGPVVDEVGKSFDGYWNSPYAVPASALITTREDDPDLATTRARLALHAEQSRNTPYGAALAARIAQTKRAPRPLEPARATLIADPPEKAAGDLPREATLSGAMLPHIAALEHQFLVVSAYFVPRDSGVALLRGLEERGVEVTVLTNSLDATDVPAVYAHYTRSRPDLLDAGVDLWELRAEKERPDRTLSGLGLSRSALHAKAFVLDEQKLFIGSFNWDPRSVRINSEMGILVESPRLATQAARNFKAMLPEAAFHLRRDDRGGIDWLEHDEGNRWRLYRSAPVLSRTRALTVPILAVLPIGGQL
ncbi:phospholipase D family protein [Alloyangia pacifica]|uniref:phospholipase D family protein n=1 Tax=Alloyangia pacifica TaxID=311180 RepID=UPI001CD642AD|nr:phospholipase D family protein [Alloyangia pacifica]MCA0993952.1 phospholipase D family protein [Alloyangia pacifica]